MTRFSCGIAILIVFWLLRYYVKRWQLTRTALRLDRLRLEQLAARRAQAITATARFRNGIRAEAIRLEIIDTVEPFLEAGDEPGAERIIRAAQDVERRRNQVAALERRWDHLLQAKRDETQALLDRLKAAKTPGEHRAAFEALEAIVWQAEQ